MRKLFATHSPKFLDGKMQTVPPRACATATFPGGQAACAVDVAVNAAATTATIVKAVFIGFLPCRPLSGSGFILPFGVRFAIGTALPRLRKAASQVRDSTIDRWNFPDTTPRTPSGLPATLPARQMAFCVMACVRLDLRVEKQDGPWASPGRPRAAIGGSLDDLA